MFHTIYDTAGPELTSDTLGGKGYGLLVMQSIPGVNVPPAVILPTGYSVQYNTGNADETMAQIKAMIPDIKAFFIEKMGYMPLLSIRSGAKVSMPGMMDTVLNVGIDKKTSPYWVKRFGKDVFEDTFKRLIKSYTDTCYGGVENWMPAATGMLTQFEALYGKWPNVDAQIEHCVRAVLESWTSARAVTYRKMHNIPNDMGTAVVIQAMVFGNLNDKSATGVLFTRNPDSGHNSLTGEFLVKAQGEDVVSGKVTPLPLHVFAENMGQALADELWTTAKKIEEFRGDAQDIEFTIEDGKLYILQSRVAKRSARAAIRIALDRISEGVTPADALSRVTMREYGLAQVKQVVTEDPPRFVGLAACAGAATGKVVLTSAAALECKEPCILVREETDPDDIAGMKAAAAIVTMKGGATSHAAVIARSMNKPAVVGCEAGIENFHEGMTLTVDGATGRVWDAVKPVTSGMGQEINALHAYAYAELGALPVAATAVAPKQVLDISSEYLRLDFEDYVANEVAKCEEVLLLHDPDVYEAKSLRVYGIDPATCHAMVAKALKALTPAERAKITTAGPVAGVTGVKVLKHVSSLEEIINAEIDYLYAPVLIVAQGDDARRAMKTAIGWKSQIQGIKPILINSEYATPTGQDLLYATDDYAVGRVLGG